MDERGLSPREPSRRDSLQTPRPRGPARRLAPTVDTAWRFAEQIGDTHGLARSARELRRVAEPVHASRAVRCHRRNSSAVTTFWKWSQWPPGRGGDGRGQAAGGGGAEPREHGRLPPATAACAGLRGRRLLPGPQEATSVTGDVRPRRRAACEQHGTVTINCPSAHGGLSHPLTRAPSPAAGWTPAPQGHGLLRDGEGPPPLRGIAPRAAR